MLSAVVLTKNEEENIKTCLDSLKFCDEIIVVDDGSQDKTVEIAESYGAKIYKHPLNNDFSKQREFGLQQAKGEWVLFVDADEVVTDELQKEIQSVIASDLGLDPGKRGNLDGIASSLKAPRNDVKAYYLKRRDVFWGRELKYGETKKVRDQGLIRLMKKNSGHWKGQVHEEFECSGDVGTLDAYLEHYPHPTIKEFLKDVNYYSTLRAKELHTRKKKTNIFEIVFFPLAKFILNYFVKLGFLDGAAGFTYAFFMSFHSFLVRAKLYQYWMLPEHPGGVRMDSPGV